MVEIDILNLSFGLSSYTSMSKICTTELPNQQMRAYQKSSLFEKVSLILQKLRGVNLGSNVIIGKGARFLRYPQNIHVADDVILKQGCHLCPCRQESVITIGERTTVGFYTLIYATSEITIGQDCMIAPFVYIVDSDHGIHRDFLMNRQANTSAPILIGRDVWIGAHSVILKGVQVQDGAVVAAGSVVREDVPSYAIVGGVPAKIIGERI